MRRPETRYVKNGDAYIAYQIVGDGSTDLVVLTQWFSHVDGQWDLPPLAAFLERLASFSRVISFDKRGTGLSDPVTVSLLPSIEDWMDDLRVVLDENGVERVAIVANLGSAFMAAVFAATYPERVTALVLVNAYARFTRSPDYPWGFEAEERARVLDQLRAGWGKAMLAEQWGPSMLDDPALLDAVAAIRAAGRKPGDSCRHDRHAPRNRHPVGAARPSRRRRSSSRAATSPSGYRSTRGTLPITSQAPGTSSFQGAMR